MFVAGVRSDALIFTITNSKSYFNLLTFKKIKDSNSIGVNLLRLPDKIFLQTEDKRSSSAAGTIMKEKYRYATLDSPRRSF